MNKKFVTVLPFWPLKVSKPQDYFFMPVYYAKKYGFDSSIYVVGHEKREEIYCGVTINYCNSLLNLYSSIPKNTMVLFQTTYKNIFFSLLFFILFPKKCKLLWIPHTSFGMGFPSNIPFNIYKVFGKFLKRINCILAITKYEKAYLESLGFKNVSFLPHIIEQKKSLKKIFSRNYSNLNFLFFGGSRKVKGLNNVVKAFSVLPKIRLKTQLYVLGEVEEPTKNTSIVKYLGWVNPDSKKFKKVMNNANYHINNSLYEGFPLGVLECALAKQYLCLSDIPTLKSLYSKLAYFHNPLKYYEIIKSVLFIYYNTNIVTNSTKFASDIVNDYSKSSYKKTFREIISFLDSEK